MSSEAQQRIKDIAQATGLKKSSIHRHQQGIGRRNQHAESSFWETPAGYCWLARLVIAVVYYFGIQQGIGAESLSRFFKAIRICRHPSAY